MDTDREFNKATNDVKDLAERVKKFYSYRAFFLEQLIENKIDILAQPPQMPPETYNPLQNFQIDFNVLAFSALDGLSSMWQALEQTTNSIPQNKKRFISFLSYLDSNFSLTNYQIMNRVCTPFLCHSLEEQNIEQPFRDEVKRRWGLVDQTEPKRKLVWDDQLEKAKDSRQSHSVYQDPFVDELKNIYSTCATNNSSGKYIKNIDDFTYAGLIYKFYRNPFIHEFRASQYAITFNRGEEISVRNFSERPPQLDVGFGVLIKGIRSGADLIYNLIENKSICDIPYSFDNIPKIQIK